MKTVSRAKKASNDGTISLPAKNFQDLMGNVFRAGHVRGFTEANEPSYENINSHVAEFLKPFLQFFIKEWLNTNFATQSDMWFSVDAKRSSIKIVVSAKEEKALAFYNEIYSELETLEAALLEYMPQLNKYHIETHMITYSENCPIYTGVIIKDFPHFLSHE